MSVPFLALIVCDDCVVLVLVIQVSMAVQTVPDTSYSSLAISILCLSSSVAASLVKSLNIISASLSAICWYTSLRSLSYSHPVSPISSFGATIFKCFIGMWFIWFAFNYLALVSCSSISCYKVPTFPWIRSFYL